MEGLGTPKLGLDVNQFKKVLGSSTDTTPCLDTQML